MNSEYFNQPTISEKLKSLPLGVIEYHSTIGSTNDRAAELALENAPNFSLVIADEQTKGRGRSGRTWFTPPGTALAFSVVLKPKPNILNSEIAMISGLGAIAVAQGINSTLGLDAKIKWPNDVLLVGNKVSGVLAEAHWVGEELQSLVLGIGINISKNSVPHAEELNFPASSLNESVGREIDRLIILEAVIKQLISLWPKIGSPLFMKTWSALLEYRGEQVQMISGKEIAIIGEIRGLAEDGSLILKTENGLDKHYKVGEIHLRPKKGN